MFGRLSLEIDAYRAVEMIMGEQDIEYQYPPFTYNLKLYGARIQVVIYACCIHTFFLPLGTVGRRLHPSSLMQRIGVHQCS